MGKYQQIVGFIRNQEGKIEKLKNTYAEYSSIEKKSMMFKDIRWSLDEKKCFEDFWVKYFGKKIPDKWHRLYQSVNGVFNEKYFPEYLYSIYLEPIINPRYYAEVFSDKNMLNTLFSDVAGLAIPQRYIYSVNGKFFDGSNSPVSKKKADILLSEIKDCVCKPTVDTGSGYGVVVITNAEKKMNLDEMQTQYNGNFVIQEKIECCAELKQLSPCSVSTFRVMTYLTDDGFFTAPLALRIGTGKSKVDNIHAGGIVISVSDEGVLNKTAYRLGYGDKKEEFLFHPDTGISFDGYKIPMVYEMLEVAKKLHARIPQLGLVSWDFTINNKNEVVLIEANTRDQSVWFPQMVSGKAIFGEQTDYFVKLMKK